MAFQKGNRLAAGGKRIGSGRKPLAVRQLCAKSFAERIRLLEEIADDAEERATDRIAALALLAKTGIPAQVEDVSELPRAVMFTVPELPPLPEEFQPN
jgi:hypothetical protein